VCARPQVNQQIVETEHLFKALMEQPNGLARRVLAKAGSNPTELLEKTDAFIRRQPKVSGDSQQVRGRRRQAVGAFWACTAVRCELAPVLCTAWCARARLCACLLLWRGWCARLLVPPACMQTWPACSASLWSLAKKKNQMAPCQTGRS